MHEFLLSYAQWCHRMHRELAWWAPMVLAFYSGELFWVLWYPARGMHMVRTGRRWKLEDEHVWFIWKTTLFALGVFYALWFALPYPGTELLFMLFASPFALIYGLAVFVIPPFLQGFGVLTEGAERLEYGMTVAEWDMFQRERAQRHQRRVDRDVWNAYAAAEQATHDAQPPSDANLEERAQVERSRFRVIAGAKAGKERER